MSTVLYIHAHSGGGPTLNRHWPYFKRSGVRLVGVEPRDTACAWPDKDLFIVKAGWERGFQPGDVNLIEKLLDTYRHFLSTDHTDACIVEYDSIVLKPLPPHPGGFLTIKVVGPMEGCKGSGGYHTPWWADRQSAECILKVGEEMVAAKDIENGSPDMFLGLLLDRTGLPWKSANAFSANTIDDYWMPHAKKAVRDGVEIVHGIKSEEMLNRLMA